MPALFHRLDNNKMIGQVLEQIKDLHDQVEFICVIDNGPMPTGTKIGRLMEMSRGAYVCVVADDDEIADDYVSSLLAAIEETNADVITFDHTYSVNGRLVAITKQIPRCAQKSHHDKDPRTDHRLPGPLCPVRRPLALRFDHPPASDKEDLAYKEFLRDIAETYYNIDKVLYHHLWHSGNKKERSRLKVLWKRQ
jgi:hypothetical protein